MVSLPFVVGLLHLLTRVDAGDFSGGYLPYGMHELENPFDLGSFRGDGTYSEHPWETLLNGMAETNDYPDGLWMDPVSIPLQYTSSSPFPGYGDSDLKDLEGPFDPVNWLNEGLVAAAPEKKVQEERDTTVTKAVVSTVIPADTRAKELFPLANKEDSSSSLSAAASEQDSHADDPRFDEPEAEDTNGVEEHTLTFVRGEKSSGAAVTSPTKVGGGKPSTVTLSQANRHGAKPEETGEGDNKETIVQNSNETSGKQATEKAEPKFHAWFVELKSSKSLTDKEVRFFQRRSNRLGNARVPLGLVYKGRTVQNLANGGISGQRLPGFKFAATSQGLALLGDHQGQTLTPLQLLIEMAGSGVEKAQDVINKGDLVGFFTKAGFYLLGKSPAYSAYLCLIDKKRRYTTANCSMLAANGFVHKLISPLTEIPARTPLLLFAPTALGFGLAYQLKDEYASSLVNAVFQEAKTQHGEVPIDIFAFHF